MPDLFELSLQMENDLISFTQRLVQTRSYSGQEEAVIRLIEEKMKALGFDEVSIDSMGNILGRIGSGPRSILFDSHVDTVEVKDESSWDYPPFSGQIVDGRLYGRGAVDMKSSVAASIYAALLARENGLTEGKTVYLSCTVYEEDCDGENLKHLFKEKQLKPDMVVICEPSGNNVTIGHKGKAQVSIRTHGVSAHGSAPEKGVNAIYEMAEIIQRVERANLELSGRPLPRGTLVMSKISSTSVSLNAVPSECEVYLDRRMVPGESAQDIRREMDALIAGKNASWQIGALDRKSWTGMEIHYEPFHPAWMIDLDHPLALASVTAYRMVFGIEPPAYDFWDFSTNAVTPVAMGIPTIGFGPGEYKLAHMRNENCAVRQIVDACRFYTALIGEVH